MFSLLPGSPETMTAPPFPGVSGGNIDMDQFSTGTKDSKENANRVKGFSSVEKPWKLENKKEP